MFTRKIRDENDARHCLSEAASSGLPKARWAKHHGIDARSLHAWHLILNRRNTPQSRFVEIVPQTEIAASSRTPPAGLRVHCGEIVIEVPDAFDDDVLVRVLRAVAAC